MTSQRGQTTAEYMGMLLVVAATIAALVTSDVPGAVARGVERQVCEIATQRGCDPAPRSSRPIFVGDPRSRTARRPSATISRRPPPPDREPLAGPPAPDWQRPPQGEVDDYGGGLDELIFGAEYAVIDGEVVELRENGIGGVIRKVGRLLGVGKRAWEAAKQRAKPLRINPGLLLAAEKVARVRARELQNLLPQIERERFKTMAVGVGRDPSGRLRVVIGTNNPNGNLPRAVKGAIKKGEQVAEEMGRGHAEEQVLRWMAANNLKPITMGAGRPICPACADAIARSGATAASRLK